ncbi:MAG: serine/threonine-protein kinase [Streptosporangiaceae bacterium]|jgi:serine/threonine protein kinase
MVAKTRPEVLIGGRYRLLRKLESGAGGFGRVWRAHDQFLRIDVALKEIYPPGAGGEDRATWAQRVRRECRTAARLRDHPNIVPVHDVLLEDGVPWIVMRLLHSSLADRVRTGPLTEEQTGPVARALLSALGAAHAARIVHRDVKPANVLLSESGEDVLLGDFGIAWSLDEQRMTTTSRFFGTLEYTAPERFDGEDGNPASDMFSLGATLYRAVEGVSPFGRKTENETKQAVFDYRPPVPSRAGRLAPLIMELLEKDPAARPDADSALTRLDRLTALPVRPTPAKTAPAPMRPPPQAPPPEEPPKRAYWVLLGLLAAVVLAFLMYHVTIEFVSYVTGTWHWLPRLISGIP